ncbi:MAG: tape measure protein [Micropruina sp.]|uniref:tape measure protein n=1 Tax=Micropruina sp. TaxID=2737536 RepID=UPI0039E70525
MATRAVDSLVTFAGEAAVATDATDKFKQTLSFAGLKSGAIDEATKRARAYADATVYDLATIQSTTAQLAANGIKDYSGLTEAAGNLNAVAGGNADTFKSVAMMLTQTAGAGKLTTENWNQLADAIPGASGVLQTQLKKNGAYTGNFRDAMAKGKITAAEFNKAITQLGNKPVAKEAAKSTKTFEGALGNLEATITGQLSDAITAIKPTLIDIINGFTDWVAKAGEFTKWVSDNKGQLLGLGAGLTTLAGGFTAISVAQKAAAAGGFVKYVSGAAKATKAWTVVQAAFNVVARANPIGLIITGIAALVAALVVAYNTSDEFRAVCDTAFAAVGAAGRWLWNNALRPAIQAIVRGFAWVIDGVAGFLDALGNVPGFGWAKTAAAGLRGIAASARQAADGIKAIPDPKVDTGKSRKQVQALDKQIKSLKGKVVTAKAKGDTKEVERLRKQIAALKDKRVRIQASINSTAGTVSIKGNKFVMRAVADGAIFMNSGGFGREQHRAQIAPAGAWRVWAEDETGGEAYIPLASSKRARSRSIWWETGRRLGVVPFADGGVDGGGATDSGEIVDLLRQLLARMITRDDLARLINEVRAADPRPRRLVGVTL